MLPQQYAYVEFSHLWHPLLYRLLEKCVLSKTILFTLFLHYNVCLVGKHIAFFMEWFEIYHTVCKPKL